MRACPACRRPWPDGREVCPRCLATLVDVEREGWIDDRWSLSLQTPEPDVPLQPLAIAALPLAAKVLLGRARPVPADDGGAGED